MIVLKAPQEKLLGALQAVSGIVERRHTLPILANVLMRKNGDSIEFTTSDLEIQVRTPRRAGRRRRHASSTTVGARKLIDILQSLPADQIVTLTSSGTKLTLQAGKSRFTMQTLPADDFPLVKRRPTSARLRRAAEGAQEPDRPGALRDGRARHPLLPERHPVRRRRQDADAGGHRRPPPGLAQATLEIEIPKQEVILPRKTVLELQRLLGNADERRSRCASPATRPSSRSRGLEFVTKLVEGKFPDYNRVIPKNHKNSVILGRQPLLSSLQRAAILTSEKFKGVRVNLEPGALRIASSNAEQEEAKEELEIDYGGDAIEIGFNVTYLMDALNNIDHDMVKLELQDGNSSALITVPEQPGFKYVVMPMRI